jgi:hypothetical protein
MKTQLNKPVQAIKHMFKALLFVPFLVNAASAFSYQNDAKSKNGAKANVVKTVFLPAGYTSTQVSINKEKVNAQMLKEFYMKSGGKTNYTIYKNKEGVEVSEAEVTQKYKEENATSKAPAYNTSK